MRLILPLVFLLCPLGDAAALTKANDQDYRDIAAKLIMMKAAEADIAEEKSVLKDARGNRAEELKIKIEKHSGYQKDQT